MFLGPQVPSAAVPAISLTQLGVVVRFTWWTLLLSDVVKVLVSFTVCPTPGGRAQRPYRRPAGVPVKAG